MASGCSGLQIGWQWQWIDSGNGLQMAVDRQRQWIASGLQVAVNGKWIANGLWIASGNGLQVATNCQLIASCNGLPVAVDCQLIASGLPVAVDCNWQ